MFKTGRVSCVDGGEEAVPDGDIYIFFWVNQDVGELLLMQESTPPCQNIK